MDAICEQLLAKYEVTPEQLHLDVVDLIDFLTSKGLVRAVDSEE